MTAHPTPGPTPPGPLAGRRVLVVEDEYFLADDIARALNRLGARIIGPFGDLGDATEIVDRDFAIDAAVVDVNLQSEMVFPLARLLRARNIPFVFTTGYEDATLRARFPKIRNCHKPYLFPNMEKTLAGALAGWR